MALPRAYFSATKRKLRLPSASPETQPFVPAALPAAPAPLPFIDAEVLWGEQMPLGTRLRYTEYLLEGGA